MSYEKDRSSIELLRQAVYIFLSCTDNFEDNAPRDWPVKTAERSGSIETRIAKPARTDRIDVRK
jgi:hypothetical protein